MNIDPCHNCGLCCEHLLVEVGALDVMREPRIEIERPLGKRSVSLSVLDACWVLAHPGKPCAFLTPKKRCSIYSSRPQTCVAFMAGSAKCQELRKEAGKTPVPPPAVHDSLSEIMQAAIAETMDEQPMV